MLAFVVRCVVAVEAFGRPSGGRPTLNSIQMSSPWARLAGTTLGCLGFGGSNPSRGPMAEIGSR